LILKHIPALVNDAVRHGFHSACECGRTEIVLKLLEHMPDIMTSLDANNLNGFQLACKSDHKDVVVALVENTHFATLNNKDVSGTIESDNQMSCI
jgi:ankyrin repeat protein